jgi:hypothetical protein
MAHVYHARAAVVATTDRVITAGRSGVRGRYAREIVTPIAPVSRSGAYSGGSSQRAAGGEPDSRRVIAMRGEAASSDSRRVIAMRGEAASSVTAGASS